MDRSFVFAAFSGVLLSVTGCSSPSSPSTPSSSNNVSRGIPLAGASTLVFEDGGRLAAQSAQIEQVVKDTLTFARGFLPLDGITILITTGPENLIPEIGIGGRADAGTIRMALDPASPHLARSLETELFPLLAHEMHHVARFRTAGFSTNLFEAMLNEGLADQFSIEVAGIEPPLWSSALKGEELETWFERSRAEWFNRSYNHDAWFFGAAPPIPRWAGYTIGFELAGQFLRANPSRLPSNLFAEPAASFIPVN